VTPPSRNPNRRRLLISAISTLADHCYRVEVIWAPLTGPSHSGSKRRPLMMHTNAMAAVRAIGLRCRLRKGLIGQSATLELRARPRPWRRRAHVETCCSDSSGIPTLCFSTSGKSWGNAGPAHQQIGTLAWAALQGEDRHEDHNNRPRDCSRPPWPCCAFRRGRSPGPGLPPPLIQSSKPTSRWR